MGKQLVLAEKPSVGRELARVLGCKRGGEGYLEGDRYVVTWALGHLVTLADPDVYEKKWEKWDMARSIGSSLSSRRRRGSSAWCRA